MKTGVVVKDTIHKLAMTMGFSRADADRKIIHRRVPKGSIVARGGESGIPAASYDFDIPRCGGDR